MFSAITSTTIGKILCTLFISMVPVIELRGALPIGVGMGLTPVTALIVSIIGNTIPVPIVILFIRKIMDFMKRFQFFAKFANWLENKAMKHEGKIQKYEALGLFILVAIPLPGTGAYTGSLVAALFDIRLKTAFPVIFAGVVTAGLIVFFITYGIVAIV
ncbi:MAG: small multi-drug export protein [Firmicutes bacterium]|nr:small multi-drug export protein [Bacillota bacterium]